MTKADLGLKLKEMYDNALDGEKVAMIHLFGIKYEFPSGTMGTRETLSKKQDDNQNHHVPAAVVLWTP